MPVTARVAPVITVVLASAACLTTPPPTAGHDGGVPDAVSPDAGRDGPIDVPSPELCVVHAGPPAGNACVTTVSGFDDRCEAGWDEVCVRLADRLCNLTCGEIVVIAAAGELSVARWSGDELVPFWSATDVNGMLLHTAAWGDHDDDGRPDLATCEGSVDDTTHALRIWHNDGTTWTRQFVADPGYACHDVRWVDLDEDGDLDVSVASAGGARRWVNDGGTFPTMLAPSGALPGNFTAQAWRDLDRDGRPDVAVAQYNATVEVFDNDTTLAKVYVLQADPRWNSVMWQSAHWTDVDADNAADLVISGAGAVLVLHNTTTTGFVPAAEPVFVGAASRQPVAMPLDADEDGDPDLLVLSLDDPMRLYRNDHDGGAGAGFTAAPVWISGETAPFESTDSFGHIDVGDLDGDRHLDVVACVFPAPCRMWRGDGTDLAERWFDRSARRTFEMRSTAAWAEVAVAPE